VASTLERSRGLAGANSRNERGNGQRRSSATSPTGAACPAPTTRWIPRCVPERALERAIDRAIAAGADWIQVREKDLQARPLEALVRRALQASGGRARIFVNDRLDVALAAGAAGVHLGETSLPVARVAAWRIAAGRPEFAIGVSCHSRRPCAQPSAPAPTTPSSDRSSQRLPNRLSDRRKALSAWRPRAEARGFRCWPLEELRNQTRRRASRPAPRESPRFVCFKRKRTSPELFQDCTRWSRREWKINSAKKDRVSTAAARKKSRAANRPASGRSAANLPRDRK
jgi:hypothetical protein